MHFMHSLSTYALFMSFVPINPAPLKWAWQSKLPLSLILMALVGRSLYWISSSRYYVRISIDYN